MDLLDFATDRQREIYLVVQRLGSNNKAAIELGLNRRTVDGIMASLKSKAAKGGWSPEHDLTHVAAPGFNIKGTSTLYDSDGNLKIQWVKTDRERENDEERLEYIKEVAESFKYTKINIKPPKGTDEDLLNIFPWGDPHFGLLSWPDELGEDYNLQIAADIHRAAMTDLLSTAPKAKTALLLNLGDYFHFEDDRNQSRSGHSLDGDGRAHKVFQIGYHCMLDAVCMLLQTHEKVIVRSNPGNHDKYATMHMSICMAAHFEGDDRVQIEAQPSYHWAMKFGRVGLGSTHGDTIKPQKFGEVILTDYRDFIADTDYFYVYGGHVHHEESKEYGGYRYESFPTMAGRSVYEHEGGHRSRRLMFRITIHKTDGEDSRNSTNCKRLERLGLMPKG